MNAYYFLIKNINGEKFLKRVMDAVELLELISICLGKNLVYKFTITFCKTNDILRLHCFKGEKDSSLYYYKSVQVQI